MKQNLKHSFRLLIALAALSSISILRVNAANGTYSERTINGATSTWDFGAATTGSSKKITSGTIDNDILFINTSNSNQQLASSGGLSNKANSELYIPVVSANSAGNIAITTYGSSDGRWLQLYVGANAAADTKRLWSKSNATADGKKGPQNFDFTSSDLTLVEGIYYLKLVSNNTEMKVATLTVTLSNGDTYGSGGGGGGSTTVSSDATLSAIQVDGQAVPGFAAGTYSYNMTIPASQTTDPVVSATTTSDKAQTPAITQATLPGQGETTTATIVVTAEDGTTKTYTINFSRAPLSNDATLKGLTVNGQAVAGFAASSLSYNVQVPATTTTVTIGYTTNYAGATAIVTPAATVEGTYTVTVTAENGTTQKTYTINISKAPLSNNANLASLQYNGTAVPGFAAATLTYNVELPFGTTAAAQVTATAAYAGAQVAVTQASAAEGTATILVTAEDGNTTKTYTIHFTVAEENVPPVPPTTLALHEPGVYEEKSLGGGYETPLTVFGGREYEVYYTGRGNNGSDFMTIHTQTAMDKQGGITKNETNTSCKAKDDWFDLTCGSLGSLSRAAADEFVADGSAREHRMQNNTTYKLHIKGYDQFSFYAKDKKNGTKESDHQYIEVYIDGILQALHYDQSYTIRRYDLTTGEHLIELKGIGSSASAIAGFSLRLAQEPHVKYLKGNDTTQVIYIGQTMKPVTYFTKYNSLGSTELVWDGATPVSGISLAAAGSSSIGDTLNLSGKPMAPAGVYTYKVIAKMNGKETNHVSGTITLATKIQSITDTTITVYTTEAMDEIKFSYYAMSGSDVTLTWLNTTPAGISGAADEATRIYTISGTPTQAGRYPYSITVAGGETITGVITVEVLDLGNDPILYLYKNSFDQDGIYLLLRQQGKNPVARKAASAPRDNGTYSKYKWAVISEDVDANNPEALALAKGEVALPVLSMKVFTYSSSRLDWGEPNNGSRTNTKVTVQQPNHWIFRQLSKAQGAEIQIIDSVKAKGLMPAAVDLQGSVCLATALTQSQEDYFGDGPAETFLHEVPVSMRSKGKKYLCFPLAGTSNNLLTPEGKSLFNKCVEYLLNSEATITLPKLEISSFTLNGVKGNIVDSTSTIRLELPAGTDATKLVPTISLADPTTHVNPSASEAQDFSSSFYGVRYTVTDFINIRNYMVYVTVPVVESLRNVLTDEGIKYIYDISGRLLRTTTEPMRNLGLPHGLYLVATPAGTEKVML